MRKRFLIGLLLSAGALPLPAAFDVAADGKSDAVIVLPAEPSRGERFAAQELRNYLEEIAGVRLPMVADDETPEGPAILIGSHPGNAETARKLDAAQDGYERYAIRVAGDKLHLTAPHTIGLTHAVWDYLEELGVDWLLPTRLGTYVPKLAVVRAEDREDYLAPPIEFRSSTNYANAGEQWYIDSAGGYPHKAEEQGVNAARLHAMRLRLNSNCTFDKADSYVILGAGHSYMYYLPIERYGKEHPEYFGEKNGRRQQPGEEWQICSSNVEAAELFAANALEDIRKNLASGVPPERILLFVSPNDHESLCDCAECAKLIDPDGYRSSQILHFANLVADAVHRREPEVKIIYYVYHNYGRIPTKEEPHRNVYPFITAWTANNSLAVNNAKPLTDPAGNRIFAEVYDWFANHADGVFVYPYYGHYLWFTPWPMVTQMKTDLPRMYSYGNFKGMDSESHLHWGTQNLNFYLHPKLLWNPELDVEAAVETYCRKAYGPAAPEALAYYRLLQRQMDGCGYICGEQIEITAVLTPEVMAECGRLMAAAAEKLPEMDEATAWRTEVLLAGWRYSAKFGRMMQLIRYGDRPECQPELKQLFDEINAFADTEFGKLVFENRIIKGVCGGVADAVKINLAAIPKGDSYYSDRFLYGGTLKFYADFENTQFDLWGVQAQPGREGRITLPLKTAEGVFKKVMLDFYLTSPGMRLWGVDAAGQQQLIRDFSASGPTGPVEVPEALLGREMLTLVWTLDNASETACGMLLYGSVSCSVE